MSSTNTMQLPRPGIYEHFKGGLYEVIAVAKHSETLEEVVVYRHLNGHSMPAAGSLWVRPRHMFCESVIVDGRKLPRFRYLGTSNGVSSLHH